MKGASLLLAGVVLFGIALRPAPGVALDGDYEAATARVPVKLTSRLSSQDNKAGDRFTFDTTSSAQVEGVFLPAGTHGYGVVVAARAARGPYPGQLTVAAKTLDLPDGRALAVGLAPGELDIELRGDRRDAPVTVNGAAMHLGRVETTNVIYEKGTRFAVVAPPQESDGGAHG